MSTTNAAFQQTFIRPSSNSRTWWTSLVPRQKRLSSVNTIEFHSALQWVLARHHSRRIWRWARVSGKHATGRLEWMPFSRKWLMIIVFEVTGCYCSSNLHCRCRSFRQDHPANASIFSLSPVKDLDPDHLVAVPSRNHCCHCTRWRRFD